MSTVQRLVGDKVETGHVAPAAASEWITVCLNVFIKL